MNEGKTRRIRGKNGRKEEREVRGEQEGIEEGQEEAERGVNSRKGRRGVKIETVKGGEEERGEGDRPP